MSIKINTKLFTVEEIVTKFNHSKSLEILFNLEEIVDEFLIQKEHLSTMAFPPEKTINDIDKQLRYLALNIRTLNDVIDNYERNSFQNLMTEIGISVNIPKN